MTRIIPTTIGRTLAGVAGAVVLAGAALPGAASAATPLTSSALPTPAALQAVATSSWNADRAAGPAIEVEVDGDLLPNAELTVLTPCTAGDRIAVAIASFGDVAVLTPAADRGALIGTVTAPNTIGPGPDGGPHLIRVVCQSGANSTVALPSAGNGDAASAAR